MFRKLAPLAVIALVGSSVVGCATAPKSASGRASLLRDADATVARFKSSDSTMSRFFDSANGWAVFPTVGKGAIGVGGAYGRGILYEDDAAVGYCDLTQGSIGFQFGGQAYSEIIFFEDNYNLNQFKDGQVAFAAQASAVAATAGASADADYAAGVAVFTMSNAGLMYEASIGGQGFSFEPMD